MLCVCVTFLFKLDDASAAAEQTDFQFQLLTRNSQWFSQRGETDEVEIFVRHTGHHYGPHL